MAPRPIERGALFSSWMAHARLCAARSLQDHLAATHADFFMHDALEMRATEDGDAGVSAFARAEIRAGALLLRVPDRAKLSLDATRDLELPEEMKSARDGSGRQSSARKR